MHNLEARESRQYFKSLAVPRLHYFVKSRVKLPLEERELVFSYFRVSRGQIEQWKLRNTNILTLGFRGSSPGVFNQTVNVPSPAIQMKSSRPLYVISKQILIPRTPSPYLLSINILKPWGAYSAVHVDRVL